MPPSVFADVAPTGWCRVLGRPGLVLPALLAADLRHLGWCEEASLSLRHCGDEVACPARLEHLVTVRLLVLSTQERGREGGGTVAATSSVTMT